MIRSSIPPGYRRIRQVRSLEELVSTRFADGVNALYWERTLPGDFGEVARELAKGAPEGISTIGDSRLQALVLSPAGRTAVDVLLEDQQILRTLGLEPVLDLVTGHHRNQTSAPIVTDVYSFHADSATDEADTYLCTYQGLPTEGLRNNEALRRVDVPQTREELKALFGGGEGPEFQEYLTENYFDLHYVPTPGAEPFSFGQGNLWRIAVDYPGCPVPPCIHRAPETRPGDAPRLLLIS